jgi:hypothetical protein
LLHGLDPRHVQEIAKSFEADCASFSRKLPALFNDAPRHVLPVARHRIEVPLWVLKGFSLNRTVRSEAG